VDQQQLVVESVEVAEDGLSAVLHLDRLVKGHCHELDLDLVAEDGEPLLHRHAYYTVNAIPSASPR
jgi:hypothetical protein